MPAPATVAFRLGDLAAALGIELAGDVELSLLSAASPTSAGPNDLCFLQSRRFLQQLRDSKCGAVIVPLGFEESLPRKSLLYSANPQLDFVRAIALMYPDHDARPAPGVHPSTQVAASAQLGRDVCIAENCVIGEGAVIGDGSRLDAGCIIESGCRLGANGRLHSRVTLGHDVQIGANVILHSGVVIGADGFGLVLDGEKWVKVPQLGRVRIGNDVEIGANTTVDRGALDDTVIGNGVKLDNQIQVAHNVIIGDNTAISGCVGIAGSAVIGKNCKISGAAVVLGHLTIADDVTITAMSLVTKSITESGTYSSGTPLLENRLWHRNNARYKLLDEIARSVSRLEKNQD